MEIDEGKDKINEVYDQNKKDYYLIIEQKHIYFNDIYNSIKNTNFNDKYYFEIVVDEIPIKIKVFLDNFFYILLNDNIKEIPIQNPKTIKINNYTRKCYNKEQILSFFNENKIDPSKIMFNKNKILIGNILVLNEDIIELEFETELNLKNEKFEIFKYKSYGKDTLLLSDLIKGKKNYISFTENSNYFISKKRLKFLESIHKGNFSQNNIMIYGPSGIGKTVSLLYYRFYRANYVLYLNFDSLFSHKNKNDIFKEIIDELSFCFSENNTFNEFIKNYLIKTLIKKNRYTEHEFIAKCIKKIIKRREIIIGKGRKILLLIIDQYKYRLDNNKIILNNLNKYKENIDFNFIICPSMNEDSISEILYQNLFFEYSDINLYFLDSFDVDISFLNDVKKKYVMEFGCYPQYVEEIHVKKEEEIEEYISNKLKGLTNEINEYILSRIGSSDSKVYKIVKEIINNEGRDIDKNKMERIYRYLPLKYIIPLKKKDNTYTFKYSFPFIQKVLNNILQNSTNEIHLDLLENSQKADNVGWNFEHLVKNFFKIDSIPFPDLNMKIKQEIQVDSIFDFKSLTINTTLSDKNIGIKKNEYIYKIKNNEEKHSLCKNLIIKDGIIVINQKPCGESYDGALLVPNKNGKNEFSMLLDQATLDKNKENFLCKDKISDSLSQIKNNFETIFDISISNFYFMYILYLQRKGTTQVEKLCNYYNNNLYWCYYEPKNNKLYNKNMGELKWDLIKKNCRIINYSEDFKNFNKTSYYIKEINHSILQKITASKLKKETEIEIKSIQNNERKKEIIENLKLNIMTNFDNNVKIEYLNKKRRRKKHIAKRLIKTKKNIEKRLLKKKYIESNSLHKFNELIPGFSELEKKYIIKNIDNGNYTITDQFKILLFNILGINNVEIIERNFIILDAISYDNNNLLSFIVFPIK